MSLTFSRVSRRLLAGIACTALLGLGGAAQSQQLGTSSSSPVPEGLASPEQSAGFTTGNYHLLDQLPDWGGIWFLQRGDPAVARQNQPQLQGEYLAQFERWRDQVIANDGVELRNRSNCSPPGLPRIMQLAQYPYEFLFTPGRVTINQEAWMQTRTIWTDGRTHPALEDITPSFHGHSIGHWEGGTLVVDTIGISDTLEVGEGGKHSDQFRLEERIHLSPDNPDVLVNEMRMTDPLAFAAPFEMTVSYRRDRHGALIEFQCAENDRNPVNDNGETLYL